jgi:hypothetical protein
MINQPGQMTWSPEGGASTGILHLRLSPLESWKPYTEFPDHSKPDFPSTSKGYATFVALIKQQWQYVR